MKKNILTKNIYILEDFWSKATCEDFIDRSEQKGYEPATIITESGPRLVDHIRNNNRVMWKDFDLAEKLWQDFKIYAPEPIGASEPVGFNELFRFYRYQPGQQFRRHRDNSFIRNNQEASYYTFMIYLNDNFSGGETTFENVVVHPRQGTALVFLHYLLHEGTAVLEGTKYVLRTDIMFHLKK